MDTLCLGDVSVQKMVKILKLRSGDGKGTGNNDSAGPVLYRPSLILTIMEDADRRNAVRDRSRNTWFLL